MTLSLHRSLLFAGLILLAGAVRAEAPPTVAVRIDGEGYLRFARNGEVVYARSADLTIKNGRIASTSGPWVLPAVPVEGVPTKLSVDLQGRILGTFGSETRELGRLVLANFDDETRPVESDGFYKMFAPVKLGEPGEGLFGVIRTGATNAIVVHQPSPIPADPDSTEVIQIENALSRASGPVINGLPAFTPDSAFHRNGGIEIVIGTDAEVEGTMIRLESIAQIHGEATQVAMLQSLTMGNVPALGAARIFDRTAIMARLRQAGLDPQKVRIVGPIQTKVVQATQTVTHEQFIQAAELAAQKEYGDFVAESQRPISPMPAPKGTLELITEKIRPSGATLSVTIAVHVNGKRINSRTITLENRAIPLNIEVGSSVSIIVRSGDVRVESTGKVKKIDRLTGQITVTLPTGKELVGRMTKDQKIEVKL